MQKSLFVKIFTMFIGILLAALILLGVLITTFSSNYWVKEKQSTLLSEATSISDQLSDIVGMVNFDRYAQRLVDALSRSSGGETLVTDTAGTILYSGGKLLSDNGTAIPSDFAQQIAAGETVNLFGNMNKLLREDCYLVGVPVLLQGNVVGIVVNALPATDLHRFESDILRIFLMGALLVVVLAFAAAYVFSARTVRPLREMAEAARCMAKGDFTKYIRVNREDEIGELAVAFNNMTRSIAAGEEMRRGFIANVSHELKTPMTSISGFIDGILDGTIAKDEQKKYLTIVSDEVKRLARLVVSMLNLSKLEAGEIDIAPTKIDLDQILLNVALGFERQISEKHIEVEGMDSLQRVTITADADLMHQAIYNLVENAIKYTPDGGTITVSAAVTDGRSELSIKNTGKGIASRDLAHIFDRFYKIDKSRGADKNSFGLGLYIVKTIIGLMGGNITVSSVENEYCKFTLYFDPPAPQAAKPSKQFRKNHFQEETNHDGK